MISMGLGLHPFSFRATWVPSPQSMSTLKFGRRLVEDYAENAPKAEP